jgi:hypothetical protein
MEQDQMGSVCICIILEVIHSGNNKRAIGTFDIRAATGAFYSCGIRIRL